MLVRRLCYAVLNSPRLFQPFFSSSTRHVSSTPIHPTINPSLSTNSRRRCIFHNICDNPVNYHDGLRLQKQLHGLRQKDPDLPDALVMLEHEPVYTLGTASLLKHVLFEDDEYKECEGKKPLLVRTDRGGEVTYHGPGQLVVYPILNLRGYRKDLHWYLRSLEDVVIRLLEDDYGLNAGRMDGMTGVWVDGQKVCAMGIKVSKWITMHGLALNVNVGLDAFERIVPCGIHEYPVSSLQELLGNRCPTMRDVRRAMLEKFRAVFGPWDVLSQAP